MNRFTLTVGAALVLALGLPAPPLEAQSSVSTKKANLSLSGQLSLVFVQRNDQYFQTTIGDGTPGNTGTTPFVSPGLTNADRVAGAGSTDRDHSEFYLDPNLRLNFEIKVGDQAKGVIELRTPFVNPDAGGKDNTPGTGFFSGFKERNLEVKQLYAEVDELAKSWVQGDGLLLRAGIMDFKKELRSDNNHFLIGTGGSEHPFDSATGAPPGYSAGLADTLEPAGGYGAYHFGHFVADFWFFSLDEVFNANIAPGLASRRDLLFWGGSLNIPLGVDSEWGKAFFTIFDLMNGTNTHLVTEGGGLVFFPVRTKEVNFVELFGEIYFQQGTYARNASVSNEDIDQQEAFALNVGGKFKTQKLGAWEFVPYFEASYVEVSGDDDSTDDVNQNFVSLENNNRTLVVENGYYGYDIDTNYRGVRLAGGFDVKRFHFEILYAFFELQDNSGGRVAGGASSSSKLGDEIDVTLGYEYSESLKLQLQTGWLTGSRALGDESATIITLMSVLLDF